MLDQHLEPEYDRREGIMESHRERAIKSIAMGLNTNTCIDEVATCIAYAYLEGRKDAVNLVHNLFLSQIDMCAIIEDSEGFWEEMADAGYYD